MSRRWPAHVECPSAKVCGYVVNHFILLSRVWFVVIAGISRSNQFPCIVTFRELPLHSMMESLGPAQALHFSPALQKDYCVDVKLISFYFLLQMYMTYKMKVGQIQDLDILMS